MNHGWQWALCYFFGVLSGMCFLICWYAHKRRNVLRLLYRDIYADSPGAFKARARE